VIGLDGLNPPQREAVLHDRGPMLVLAGAGSGKTRVVTMRIARLLLEGTNPRSILAVTFTNKAAKEMKERVHDLVGWDRARGVTISTFHSLCARMLRRDAPSIDLSPNFQILDTADQLAQLTRVAKEAGVHLDEVKPRNVLGRIGLFKNRGLLPDEVQPHGDIVTQLAARLYGGYAAHLRELSAVDFDDLLLLARELLRADEDVRDRYRAQWHQILIDEYQDTNPLQLDLVRLIVGEHKNVCVVGDDDQAIYGFRGADVENILLFDKHFGGAKIVKLEQNYRSTGAILDAANAVIAQTPGRRGKTLFSALGAGELPRMVPCVDGDAEGAFVARECGLLLSEGRYKPDDMAVLYRAGPQSRLFEEHLRNAGVPYRVVGGQEFFERREVKDVMAYLTLIARPDTELAFRRVVNLPSRGLGDAAVKKIIYAAREQRVSLIDYGAEGAPGAGLKDAQRAALERFCAPLLHARAQLQADERHSGPDVDPSQTCELAILDAGIRDVIGREKDLAAREKIQDSFEEVITSLSAFADRLRDARESPDLPESQVLNEIAEGQDALGAFLDRVALDEKEREKDRQKDEDKADSRGRVTLMSLHASKGLEFPVVFFVGFEEGLIPHRRVLEEGDGGVSEERRLCYVGITRAQRLLYFTYARGRRRRNRIVPRSPSRFSDDLPEGGFEKVEGPREVTEDEQDGMATDFFSQMRSRFGGETA
jgi:superfamily I DNA/RNA helicase